ncbi:Protein kinase-like domain [Cordyceps militaris CM01]|uniref:Protein kinase-like domain n=1 Tax=Cordyceps militaris (strain CM01) TaxID=983644 RepID=G3JB26_CORMM|nr:Protein kinase-like domain [Cordyceps militaris CM01]EGX94386.1 Protein kinase-like domain [Cordyceps militaris CM01]
MGTQAGEIRALIRSSDLHPVEHAILTDFFLGAASDQDAAMHEIRRRVLASPSEPIERVLRQLKTDWRSVASAALEQNPVGDRLTALLMRRDQERCCISPPHCPPLKAPSPDYILSPGLEPLLRPESHDPQAKLLQAFIAPKNVAYLRTVLGESETNTSNAWLLSPGLGAAMRRHKLTLQELTGLPRRALEPINMAVIKEMRFGAFSYDSTLQCCDGSPLPQDRMNLVRLKTDSPELPLPSPYLLQLQRAFAETLEQFSVEEECLKPWPVRQTAKFWNRGWLLFFRRLWHFVPRFIRTYVYRMLISSEKGRLVQIYKSQSAGLIAKIDGGNEAAALALLEREAPGVPAPLLIDTYTDEGNDVVIMTQVPGQRTLDVLFRMTYQERRQLADDLGKAVAQLRRVPNRSGYLFTGVARNRNQGARICDAVVGDQACGPFHSEDEWNLSMTGGEIQSWRLRHPEALSSPKHGSVFTHADLHLNNILVDGGQFSGIVDWEISGFYPEYWENAKGMNAGLNCEESQPIHNIIWKDKYKAECDLVAALMAAFPWGPPRIQAV